MIVIIVHPALQIYLSELIRLMTCIIPVCFSNNVLQWDNTYLLPVLLCLFGFKNAHTFPYQLRYIFNLIYCSILHIVCIDDTSPALTFESITRFKCMRRSKSDLRQSIVVIHRIYLEKEVYAEHIWDVFRGAQARF